MLSGQRRTRDPSSYLDDFSVHFTKQCTQLGNLINSDEMEDPSVYMHLYISLAESGKWLKSNNEELIPIEYNDVKELTNYIRG